jgi:hypothetical protein
MTSLHVGIVGREPGWHALLKREGVPTRDVAPPFKAGDHPVLVVGTSATRDEISALRSYINDGGAVLIPPAHAATLAGISTNRKRSSTLVPSADAAFRNTDLVDLHRHIHIPDQANILRTMGGRNTGFIGRGGNGHLLYLPFDVPEMLNDARSGDCSFGSVAKRLPFEHVSVVSKGSLRILVMRAIKLLFHRRGLPFVHLWYYPHRAPSVFAFRVDTDFGSEEEITTLYRFLRTHHIPATWFVHVGVQRELLPQFGSMEGHEIAVHCNRHRVFTNQVEASRDLTSALDSMRAAGITPQGHAAPFGRWTEAIEGASSQLGIEYRSEFSLGYDDIPFHPHDGAGLLQIPIHPIGLGSLRRHRYTSNQSIAYFSRAMERLIARRLPAIFCHHPKDAGYEVLQVLFSAARERDLPVMTMSGIADWWRQREEAVSTVTYGQGFVHVDVQHAPDGISTRIVGTNGKESFIDGTGRLTVSSGTWNDPPAFVNDEYDLRARGFNVRIPLVRGLDAAFGIFKRKEKDL